MMINGPGGMVIQQPSGIVTDGLGNPIITTTGDIPMPTPESTSRALSAIESTPWLITDGAFDQIRAIVTRQSDIEAVSRFAEQPFDHRSMVKVIGSTAVLSINGPMFRYANLFTRYSGATSTEMAASAYAQAANNPDIERIVLRTDTPGGVASGIDEFGVMISETEKEVIAYVAGDCCSAGYWLASQTDAIVVAPGAIVGCIGVRSRAPAKPGEDEMVSKYAPAKIGSRAATQAVLDELENVFLSTVASGRGVSKEHVIENYGQGGVFVGARAVESGLADAVGTLDHVLSGKTGSAAIEAHSAPLLSTGVVMTTSNKEKSDSISAEDHETAVENARKEGDAAGYQRGKDEAKAEVDTAKVDARKEERERVSAIISYGSEVKKPVFAQHCAFKTEQSVDEAKAMIDAAAEENQRASLDKDMQNTNPNLTGNKSDNKDGEMSDDDIDAVWKDDDTEAV